jgi:hypothetical protein
MSVVIEGRERPFGVLSAHSGRRRSFGGADVNFLTAVANVVSAAVKRHAEEELSREAALRDPLTGLPNRTMALGAGGATGATSLGYPGDWRHSCAGSTRNGSWSRRSISSRSPRRPA